MKWDRALSELQSRLASLYTTQASSRRIVAESGLDASRITFSDKAIENWHNILQEAIASQAIADLIDVVLHEYGEELTPVYERYRSSLDKRASPPNGKAERKVSTSRMPVTSPKLHGRTKELKLLEQAWQNPRANVITVIAWGGVGKSALINQWLRRMGRNEYHGAERVYAWSFYRQGTSEQINSADEFMASALTWFDDPDPTKGTAWEKGERLAMLVRKQRTFLILDGLEPLQFPPGPQEGKLKDHAMQAFLRELADNNPGLCVISTRIPVTDLIEFEGSTALKLSLDTLSPKAGAQILKDNRIKGTDEELEEASREYGGHSLALTLLGGYLSDVFDGDVTRRRDVRLKGDVRHGGHAQRVMTAYEKWFGEGSPEIAILRILGLFDRPVEAGAIAALRLRQQFQD